MDLKEEAILGHQVGRHWYYRAKAEALGRALGDAPVGTAIDVGSGSGFFARHLLATTGVEQIDGVDTSYDADRDETVDRAGRGGNEPPGLLRFRRSLDTAVDGADLALLMDVLEHVDDDHQLLAEVTKRVRPGGRIIITVPAFNWLWSGHDDFLDHRRRYTLNQVIDLVDAVGLDLELGYYLYGLVFPAAVAQRLTTRSSESRSSLRSHHRAVNAALYQLCRAERRLERHNRLAGLSVLVRARRP